MDYEADGKVDEPNVLSSIDGPTKVRLRDNFSEPLDRAYAWLPSGLEPVLGRPQGFAPHDGSSGVQDIGPRIPQSETLLTAGDAVDRIRVDHQPESRAT
jgi:hypothetical protein